MESNISKAMVCKDEGNKYFKVDKLLEAESEYFKALDYLPTKEWPDPKFCQNVRLKNVHVRFRSKTYDRNNS